MKTQEIAASVRRELIATAVRQVPFSLAGQVVSGLALLFVLRGATPQPVLLAWAVLWTVSLLMTSGWRRLYLRDPARRDTGAWERGFMVVCMARALVWAGAIIWMFPEDQTRQLYFVGIVFGLVSASPASLAAQRRALNVYIFIIFVPLVLRFFLVGEATAARAVLGVAIAFLMVIFMGIGRRMWESMSEAMRLRFENQALADDLARQKDVAERALALADEANAQKTRFLAAASHDLRQPVHAIGLMVSAMRTEPLPPNAAGMLDRLQTSVRGLDGLFSSLLDISRLDAGRVQAAPGPVAVRAFMAPLVERYAVLAGQKGLRLRARAPDAVVHCDRALLEAMLSNLLSNAVKYTERGSILFAARRAHLEGSPALAFEVWDTGPGIPADKVDEVFGEFVQLHNPERDRNKGLGLGLAVCRRLSLLTGQPLTLRTRVGRGSVFRVLVPLSEVAPDAIRAPVAPADATDNLAGLMVLLVDDEAEVREATRALLSAWGVIVMTAADAEEALALIDAAERYPDLLITDYRLSRGVTGLEVIAMVRAKVPQRVEAIIITGDAAFAQAPDAGVRVLSKPLAPEALRAALAMAARAGQEEAPAGG